MQAKNSSFVCIQFAGNPVGHIHTMGLLSSVSALEAQGQNYLLGVGRCPRHADVPMIIIIIIFFFFLRPHLQHMEVPRLGVQLEL